MLFLRLLRVGSRDRREIRSCCSRDLIWTCTKWAAVLTSIAMAPSVPAAALTVDEIKSGIARAAAGFKDASFELAVVEKNMEVIENVDSNMARMYEFKNARIYLKEPDKLRTEGKLGMVKFEYIINDGRKIIRAPMLKIRKESNYKGNPGKLSDALDFGILTPSLWAVRRLEVVDDPAAAAAGQTKIRLRWGDAAMSVLLWVDNKELSLKRMEKRDGDDRLKIAVVYSNHRRPHGAPWIPTRADVFAPDGAKIGASEASDLKVNSGLADTLFK